MKAWSVIGLLFVAAMLATVPISPQVTPRGVELLGVAHAQITYGQARRVARRQDRRAYRYARRAGYAAGGFGAASYGASSGYYGAPGGPGYRQVQVSPNRWCTIYPSGFRWCWTSL